MKFVISGSSFLIFDISWPQGNSTQPAMLVVDMPHYIMDGDDEDEIDAEFFDRIELKTGMRPLSFGFAPCDDVDDFDNEEGFWEYARELAEDYG